MLMRLSCKFYRMERNDSADFGYLTLRSLSDEPLAQDLQSRSHVVVGVNEVFYLCYQVYGQLDFIWQFKNFY